MKKNVFGSMLVFAAGLLSGCGTGKSTAAIPAVTPFELDRYLGTWYEIARLPQSFEQGMGNVTAEYTRREDGRVKVVNTGVRDGEKHQVTGVARFKGRADTGELRVSFFGPFYGDYKIIHLEKDYSSAMVTSGSTNYLWILSRSAKMDPERMKSYLDKLQMWGFSIEKIDVTSQF